MSIHTGDGDSTLTLNLLRYSLVYSHALCARPDRSKDIFDHSILHHGITSTLFVSQVISVPS